MDQELVQYFEERFERQEQRLNARFDRIEQRLDRHDQRFEQIDRRFEGIDRRFEAIDGRFARIDDRFDEVNDRIEEVKRHSGVLIEDLRYQVRLVAEGFATFVEGRYAQDQAHIDERFNETQALLRISFEHLTRQDDQLRQRVENLEQRDQS